MKDNFKVTVYVSITQSEYKLNSNSTIREETLSALLVNNDIQKTNQPTDIQTDRPGHGKVSLPIRIYCQQMNHSHFHSLQK